MLSPPTMWRPNTICLTPALGEYAQQEKQLNFMSNYHDYSFFGYLLLIFNLMHNRGYRFSSDTAEISSLVQFFIDLTNDSNVVTANNVETKYNIGRKYAKREKQ